MAEEVADEDSEYDDDEEEIYEQYDDYVLRGLRLFNNNINGEEHDQEDLDEEDEEASESEQEEEVAEEAEEATPPPVSYVAQKLVEQGITMEDLLKAVLCSVNNYERDYEDFERVENEIFGRVSTILNNYTPPAV
jgi:cobalamin biosynthesis protein CobT